MSVFRSGPKLVKEQSKLALRILTYNINFGFSGTCTSSKKIYEAIGKSNADIVCLQETHIGFHKEMRKLFRRKYPYSIFKEPEEYVAGGNEVMSRYPIREICWEYPEDEDGNRLEGCLFRQLIVEVLLSEEDKEETFYLLNLHLRPGVSLGNGIFDHVKAYFHDTDVIRLKEFLHFWGEMKPNKRRIVVGDFNEGKWGRTISYLKKNGYSDSAKNKTTWYWPLKWGINAFGSYDHIFSHSHFFRRKSCNVLKDYKLVSDHVAVCAELEVLRNEKVKDDEKIQSDSEESEGEEELD